jgi:cytochrome c oxidase assembly factor CtaG
MATLVVALLSPLGALSEQLSAAHMVQHMLLMVVAAPLLMAGLPGTVLIWGLPAEWRGAWARGLKSFDVDFLQKPFVPAALFALPSGSGTCRLPTRRRWSIRWFMTRSISRSSWRVASFGA